MTDKAKILYVSLVVNADDEGAVDSFTPCLQCGSGKKDLQELERNGFIATLKDGIFFITGWELFNRVQSSRLAKSDYHELIKALSASCQQNADNTLTQYSTGKVSIVEDSTVEDYGASAAPASKKAKEKRFEKPTVAEIEAYFVEIGSNAAAQRFYDHYESNGWMVGKAHMKSWKAAARNWAAREDSPSKNTPRPVQESTVDRIARLSREGKL